MKTYEGKNLLENRIVVRITNAGSSYLGKKTNNKTDKTLANLTT